METKKIERKDANGSCHGIRWELPDGRYHRIGEPALIEYDESSSISQEEWWHYGYLHRDDGPALIKYENGKVIKELWYQKSEKHRVDGPAVIIYKQLPESFHKTEYWYKNDMHHREDGPAIINYGLNGNIYYKKYYLFGHEFIPPSEGITEEFLIYFKLKKC